MDEQLVRQSFRELPLSNDFMFCEVMRNEEICTLFLEALLGKEIARIEYISKQEDLSDSYTSHGIRLDVYLKDDAGTVYCVEMQTTGGKVIFKRIRYYQGTIDRHNLKKGEQYHQLPESFIIVICTEDLFGRGRAVYKRKVTIEGCEDVVYDDGSNVYFLNCAYTSGNAAGAVLEFQNCIRTNNTDPAAYKSELMKKVCPMIHEIRSNSEKEDEYMTWEAKMMDREYESQQIGWEKGRTEEFLATLKALHEAGQTLPFMEQITRRPKAEVIAALRSLNLSIPS